MWEKLFDLMTNVYTLNSGVDRLEKDFENLRKDVAHLSEVFSQLSTKINVLVYAVQSKSDKMRMWVEKELAKFEHCLPTGEK